MAWTAPRTWAVNEIVTAAIMNGHVRDNLQYLRDIIDAIISGTKAEIATQETTTNTGWVNLDTVGPTATFSTGPLGMALVYVAATCSNSTDEGKARFSYVLRNASTDADVISPSATLGGQLKGQDQERREGIMWFPTELVANTDYKVIARYQSSDGANTARFRDRTVWAFGL